MSGALPSYKSHAGFSAPWPAPRRGRGSGGSCEREREQEGARDLNTPEILWAVYLAVDSDTRLGYYPSPGSQIFWKAVFKRKGLGEETVEE